MKTAIAEKTEKTVAEKPCAHCGNVFYVHSPQENFCCKGCAAVYSLLKERSLEQYYQLRTSDEGAFCRPPEPLTNLREFDYLEEVDFLSLYETVLPGGERMMEFFLEGVHCAACVWLVEKLPDFVPGIVSIRLNLGRSVATVKLKPSTSFAAVAREFLKLGYRPHPIRQSEALLLRQKENRMLLLRLGVAGASAGNLMILAVSLYSGLDGALAERFRWLSLLLFLPVFFFSAKPFYQSAWNAIRARQSSIDIPVVFGISVGGLVSTFNLFAGFTEIYFDSLAALVFLLLATRYVLKRIQQRSLSASHVSHFLTPSNVRRWNFETASFEDIPINQVTPGQTLQVRVGELIPADGVVSKGSSTVNYSLLTGESIPVPVFQEAKVFAGTLNLDAPLEIKVSNSGSESRLGKILQRMEETLQAKAPIVVYAEKISKIFVIFVVAIAAFILLGSVFGHWHDSLNRALALTIVTCPCAFALATPLSFSHVLGKLSKAGILVKGPDVLEKLTQIKTVFLDKTGTLSSGHPEVLEWIAIKGDQSKIQAAVLALETQSSHPIAVTLTDYLNKKVSNLPSFENFREIIGKGVSATFSGQLVEVFRSPSIQTSIDVMVDHQLVSAICLGDKVKSGTPETINCLKAMGLETFILSGDNYLSTRNIARSLGLDQKHSIASATPEEKGSVVKEYPYSLMVGDGANDAIALAAAHVGIAVRGSAEIGLRSADIFMNRDDIESLVSLLQIARETLWVVKRNLAFTVLYNIVAGYAALNGMISPLFAALLMPASAITVFISSTAGTLTMKRAFGKLNP